ncbi:unnamed protein product, partial [Didymodactylos carnosus]
SSDAPVPLQAALTSSQSIKKLKLRKNFASASCGAKILSNNAESSNPSSILYSSPDEYMLNPCNAKIWFVVELCESIRILNIEIANFELFSSVPKTFRVAGSDRYPTKDWHRYHLGTFNCTFNRTIQGFETVQFDTYLKYVRFEFLDFHGREHFCPLSIVHVHGSNVEDELITMEKNNGYPDKTEEIDKHLTDLDDDTNDEQQSSSAIGSAIINLAKKVFNLRQPSQQSSQLNPVLTSTTAAVLLSSELNPLRNVNDNTCDTVSSSSSITINGTTKYSLLSLLKQCISLLFSREISNYKEPVIFCSIPNRYCQCYENNTQFTNSNSTTPNLLSDQCGYYYLLTTRHSAHQKVNTSNSSQTTAATVNVTHHIKTDLTNDSVIALSSSSISNDNSTENLTLENNSQESDPQKLSNGTSLLPFLFYIPLINVHRHRTTVALSKAPLTLLLSKSAVNLSLHLKIDTSTTHKTLKSNISNDTTETFNVTIAAISTTTFNDAEPSITNTSLNSIGNRESAPQLTTANPWLKAMLMNIKTLPELFKIIEKLNLNLSLSNRYLEELSQHYLKKLDETQLVIDLLSVASKMANDRV